MKDGIGMRTNEYERSDKITPDQSRGQKIIRVLHIDDDSSCLMFTKRFLETNDPFLVIESTDSADEALELLEDGRFDCIIADDKMPKMDGIELAHEIRKKSTIPLIFYTGRGSEEVASPAFAAGVDDYLRKELDSSHYLVLAKRIRMAVEKYRIEELYKSVVEGSRDAIIIVIGTTIVYANQAAADLIDVTDAERLVGQDLTPWIVEWGQQKAEDTMLNLERDESQTRLRESTIRRADSELRRVEVSSSQIQYEGKPATLYFIRDITERKLMEEQPQGYTEGLEKMVKEKTRDMMNDERIGAAGMVVNVVDHDLRSPLQTIKNAIFLLRQSPKERENIIDMMDDAVDQAVNTLEELRNIIRTKLSQS